jgi:hypothetical protein
MVALNMLFQASRLKGLGVAAGRSITNGWGKVHIFLPLEFPTQS